MSIIPETNVSMRAVRSALFEETRSLWALCHSPKINKWAKYSPLTNHGAYIPYYTGAQQHPFDCETWEYRPYNVSIAKLGDFRGYDHKAFKPATLMFPENLYKNFKNFFNLGFVPDGTQGGSINFGDVYATSDKYFGVAIRKVGDPTYSWCTADSTGSSLVELDISKLINLPLNSEVEVVMFFSNLKKTIDGQNMDADFYSVEVDADTVSKKTYTIQNYIPPVNYSSVRIITDPKYGKWSINELLFDNIGIEVVGKVTSQYKFKVVLTTPDNKYKEEYVMTNSVTVNANETKIIYETGIARLSFWETYNTAIIEVRDMGNNNNLVVDRIVNNFIPG